LGELSRWATRVREDLLQASEMPGIRARPCVGGGGRRRGQYGGHCAYQCATEPPSSCAPIGSGVSRCLARARPTAVHGSPVASNPSSPPSGTDGSPARAIPAPTAVVGHTCSNPYRREYSELEPISPLDGRRIPGIRHIARTLTCVYERTVIGAGTGPCPRSVGGAATGRPFRGDRPALVAGRVSRVRRARPYASRCSTC